MQRTDDQTQRGARSVPGAAREQVVHRVARLEPRATAVLPPYDGAPLWVHEVLLEDVVQNVLEVEQLAPPADVDQLRCRLLVLARRLVVRDPELGAAVEPGGHNAKVQRGESGRGARERGECG